MRRPERDHNPDPAQVSKGPASAGLSVCKGGVVIAKAPLDHVGACLSFRARYRPPANRPRRAGQSLNDDLDDIADFQLLVGLEAIHYLESFNLMIERRHP